ncbi:MAG TPA: hypothetical protein VF970_02715 [Gemmatimonadales bacterium]
MLCPPSRAGWLVPVLAVMACQPAQQESAGAADASSHLLLASASVALPPPGMGPGSLPLPGSEGAALVAKYCSMCHAMPTPSLHSATDWPSVLRRMWLRMERVDTTFHVPVPTPGERVAMLQYMLNHAIKVAGTPLPTGPGYDAFTGTCARCHELPDPRQHSASDWVAVVRRMGQHMQDILSQPLAQSDLQAIVLYLERASRGA